jgi:hypothetical protein
MLVLNVMERQKEVLNTSWLNRPAIETLGDHLNRSAYAVPARPARIFIYDDGVALPSMFLRPRAAATAPKPRTINRGSGFSPYVMILFLLAVASLQATLLNSRFLTNEERAIENVLVVAKRNAAELPSVPSAEAAISTQSQFLVWPSSASFEDRRWSEAANMFKLLLTEQNTSAMKQAENGRLPRRLDAWVTDTQKPAAVAGACAAGSLNCWKTSIQ